MLLCEKCHRLFEDADRCPYCLARKALPPKENDLCLVGILSGVSASVAETMLSAEQIPYVTRSALGAITGQFGAKVSFLVPFVRFEDAKALFADFFPEQSQSD